MITIIICVAVLVLVVAAAAIFFAWRSKKHLVSTQFESDENKAVDDQSTLRANTVSSNEIALAPSNNVLQTLAVDTISVGESKGFFISIYNKFELHSLKEDETEAKIKRSLIEQLKNKPKGFNFEFDEKFIDDLAYSIKFDLSNEAGSSTRYEEFGVKIIAGDNDKFKFRDTQLFFVSSPHFEEQGKTYVTAEIIIQGVKAINGVEAKEVFNQLPQKFLDIVGGVENTSFAVIQSRAEGTAKNSLK